MKERDFEGLVSLFFTKLSWNAKLCGIKRIVPDNEKLSVYLLTFDILAKIKRRKLISFVFSGKCPDLKIIK